ncbi:hypothetical protein CGLO_16740 [Colletotrichum gloeosporioides Cg-14]|uniref:Uncharacterized protein n=1 Tax=Colletotrichum gloeosporioides (strain Cg-14) TaxID=1237896 RepID=T0L8M3_COLGC|nr:hypothetical protein CGLO_16740 [Colletotrichum gloeosporioides Cg-14]
MTMTNPMPICGKRDDVPQEEWSYGLSYGSDKL